MPPFFGPLSVYRDMVLLAKHAWPWLREWLFYILPALSNLVLVLLGIVLSFPTLTDEIEKTPKYRKALGIICLTAGLIGFWFDVGARRSSDQTNTKLLQDTEASLKKTGELMDKTGALITSTNDMVSRLGLMQPQLTATTDHVANIDKKLNIAKEQNDTEQIATLQAEKQVALSSLLTMAPGIVAEMRYWARRWDDEDRTLEGSWQVAISTSQPPVLFNTPEYARIKQSFDQKRTDLAIAYSKQLLPLMLSANYLREELREMVPVSERGAEDNTVAGIFSMVLAGNTIRWNEMGEATRYVDQLVRKFGPK